MMKWCTQQEWLILWVWSEAALRFHLHGGFSVPQVFNLNAPVPPANEAEALNHANQYQNSYNQAFSSQPQHPAEPAEMPSEQLQSGEQTFTDQNINVPPFRSALFAVQCFLGNEAGCIISGTGSNINQTFNWLDFTLTLKLSCSSTAYQKWVVVGETHKCRSSLMCLWFTWTGFELGIVWV